MPTAFSITLDSTYQSLVLVAGESIIDDVSDIRITRRTDGGFDCELTRAGEDTPVKLVASASPAGRLALERANGRECSSVPGFIELKAPDGSTVCSLVEDVAKLLGWERPNGQD